MHQLCFFAIEYSISVVVYPVAGIYIGSFAAQIDGHW